MKKKYFVTHQPQMIDENSFNSNVYILTDEQIKHEHQCLEMSIYQYIRNKKLNVTVSCQIKGNGVLVSLQSRNPTCDFDNILSNCLVWINSNEYIHTKLALVATSLA